MNNIKLDPIGYVHCSVEQLLRPEELRGLEMEIELEPAYAPAAQFLQPQQLIWVVYYLHKIGPWQERLLPELFARRIPNRPNPIGLTLVRVLGVEGAAIRVIGLDAVNGTPVLDIKPYRPIYDTPGGIEKD